MTIAGITGLMEGTIYYAENPWGCGGIVWVRSPQQYRTSYRVVLIKIVAYRRDLVNLGENQFSLWYPR